MSVLRAQHGESNSQSATDGARAQLPGRILDGMVRGLLLKWETEVSRYDGISGTALNDKVKVAIVLGWAPPATRSYLQLQAATFVDDFPRLKNTLEQYFDSARAWAPTGRPVATTNAPGGHADMDVNALSGRKGKGKSKGKDKDRGKGKGKERHAAATPNPKPATSDTNCFNCNDKGHYARDCLKPRRQTRPQEKGVHELAADAADTGGAPSGSETSTHVHALSATTGDGTNDDWIFQVCALRGNGAGEETEHSNELMIDSGSEIHVPAVDRGAGASTSRAGTNTHDPGCGRGHPATLRSALSSLRDPRRRHHSNV